MPSINKLLDKINQASSAVKSIKGIKSKIESIGYKGGVNTEEVDKEPPAEGFINMGDRV